LGSTGTVVISNAWYVGRHIHLDPDVYLKWFRAVLHNPEIYPDPEEFKPERFLDKDGRFQEDPRISLAFGAGKRICPGHEFVDAALFIVASSIISVFNLKKAKDENGHEIPVKLATPILNSIVV
jgi:cytochrome P450